MRRVLDPNGYSCVACGKTFPSPAGLGGHRSKCNGSPPVPLAAAVPTVTLYCECGSALTLRGETNADVAALIERAWRDVHRAQQHSLVGPDTCNLQREYRRRSVARA